MHRTLACLKLRSPGDLPLLAEAFAERTWGVGSEENFIKAESNFTVQSSSER